MENNSIYDYTENYGMNNDDGMSTMSSRQCSTPTIFSNLLAENNGTAINCGSYDNKPLVYCVDLKGNMNVNNDAENISTSNYVLDNCSKRVNNHPVLDIPKFESFSGFGDISCPFGMFGNPFEEKKKKPSLQKNAQDIKITIPRNTELGFRNDASYYNSLTLDQDAECYLVNETKVILGNTVFKLKNGTGMQNGFVVKNGLGMQNGTILQNQSEELPVKDEKDVPMAETDVLTTLSKGTIVTHPDRIPFKLGRDFDVIINKATKITIPPNTVLVEIQSGANLKCTQNTSVLIA